MARFLIHTEDIREVREFIAETNQRLQAHDLVKNPFYGSMKVVKEDNGLTFLADLEPIYPGTAFVYLGILYTAATLQISRRLSLWLIPGLFFFCIYGLFTWPFFYVMLRKGLRKKGYRGVIRLEKNKHVVNNVSGELL